MKKKKKTQKVSVCLFIVILWWYCTPLCRSLYIQGIKLMQQKQKLHMVSCSNGNYIILYMTSTHTCTIMRLSMYSDTSCLTRINTINAGLARVCAHITHRHARACITQAESGRERERDREKATSHVSITPRHSCTLPHHSIADYSSACAGWLKWSEGYFVPNRQTMRHSPAWLSLWGKG